MSLEFKIIGKKKKIDKSPIEGIRGSVKSLNEKQVDLALSELLSHVKIVKPSRPSLTYERME